MSLYFENLYIKARHFVSHLYYSFDIILIYFIYFLDFYTKKREDSIVIHTQNLTIQPLIPHFIMIQSGNGIY